MYIFVYIFKHDGQFHTKRQTNHLNRQVLVDHFFGWFKLKLDFGWLIHLKLNKSNSVRESSLSIKETTNNLHILNYFVCPVFTLDNLSTQTISHLLEWQQPMSSTTQENYSLQLHLFATRTNKRFNEWQETIDQFLKGWLWQS